MASSSLLTCGLVVQGDTRDAIVAESNSLRFEWFKVDGEERYEKAASDRELTHASLQPCRLVCEFSFMLIVSTLNS